MTTSPTVGSPTERLIRRFRFPESLGTLSDLFNFSRISQARRGSVNDYLSLSSWMGTSQIWLNNGSYLTTTSSLSQDFCPGSHPSIFVPQARPALAEETSASFLAQSGISRQEGVKGVHNSEVRYPYQFWATSRHNDNPTLGNLEP